MKRLALLLVISATLQGVISLRCFTCDNVGSGDTCINNPETIPGGSSECQSPNDEYCYTSRIEEPGNKITFNRGCCRVLDQSTVCPPGTDFQIETSTNPIYTKYLTKCDDGDLCNDSEGNDGGSGSDTGGGSIIVPGAAPDGAAQLTALGFSTMMTVMMVVRWMN